MRQLKNSIKMITFLLLSGYVFLFITGCADRPPVNLEPGSIFREYKWNGPWVNAGKWQRVTDPNASHPGAQEFLPNPTNFVNIDDLKYAIKAEIYIEMLQCNAGTHNKRIRINEKEWFRIPEAVSIPGGNPECYQTMTYPTVEVPLSIFKEGENKFEFTTFGQKCYDFGWGQFLVYGVTFRVYYSELKAHPTGEITSPAPGSSIDENPTLRATASSPAGIRQIDFIGYYEDFNYEGDNIWSQWHYNYHYGKIQHHLGTAVEAPYSITWNTDWVPDQEKPIKIMARIIDKNDICYLTPAVEYIDFIRKDRSVKLYKPYYVPEKWATRAGKTHKCYVDVLDDLDKATGAKMLLVSWSGAHAEEIGLNSKKIVSSVGFEHDLSYDEIDVPLDYIHPGVNKPYTYSSTEHHGIEVNWPGIVLKIAYNKKK